MLTLIIRHNLHFSSQRIPRILLPNIPTSSRHRQYNYNPSVNLDSKVTQYLVSLHSWKLTHKPREPTLHWNPRFRQQQQQQLFETTEKEEHLSIEQWDSWFEQKPSINLNCPKDNLIVEDQLYFLNNLNITSMPKRSRESSVSIDKPNKREKYSSSKPSNNIFTFHLQI